MAKKKVYENTIERTTAIDKSEIKKSIKWITKNEEKFRFDLAEQRGLVWKEEQKSLFIHSLMYGFPFPQVFGLSTDDASYWLLDGKQRLTTVVSFAKGEFKLHKNTPKVFGVEVAGLKFSELPEQFQDEIFDTQFTVVEMKNMTDEEISIMFQRLNNGSALTTLEVTRSMYTKLFSEVADIAEQEFFNDHISLTESARKRFVDQEIVVQIAMLLDKPDKLKGFGGSHIREYILNLKSSGENFSKAILDTFNEMNVYLTMAFNDFDKKESTKALKKINVPMVFVQGIEARKDGMSPTQFGEFVKWFLIDNYSTESAYGEACQSGSAKKESVLTRTKEIGKGYKTYIKKNPIESFTKAVVVEPEPTKVEAVEEAPKGRKAKVNEEVKVTVKEKEKVTV